MTPLQRVKAYMKDKHPELTHHNSDNIIDFWANDEVVYIFVYCFFTKEIIVDEHTSYESWKIEDQFINEHFEKLMQILDQ